MVAAEQDQKGCGSRRHEEKPGLGEGIRVEKTLSLGLVANSILLGLGGSVKNGEIQVRSGDVLGHVGLVRPEKSVRDK